MSSPSTNPLVLVADDEPTMLELVTRHLKTMDDPRLEVLEASDGEQAWRLAREHLPDLVVLDVMMPGMSGWEVCRKIREDVALAHTGVVMLTGIGENLNQMTSPLYGADAYIDKPFDFEELDKKVKDALYARASQREGVARPLVNGVAGPAKAAKKQAKSARPPAKKAAAKRAAPKRKSAPKKRTATKSPPAAKASKRKPAAKGLAKKNGAVKAVKKGASARKNGAARKSGARKTVAKRPSASRKTSASKAASKATGKRASSKKRASVGRSPGKPAARRPAARRGR
jgi:DNA-binding response OmpR family regulator